MFKGIQAPAEKGQIPEQKWPEHAIELRWIELTPPSGPSIERAHHRPTAA